MIHRWYVKERYADYDWKAEAQVFQCLTALEDTSEPANPADPLPHIIIQLSNGDNLVFTRPFDLGLMDSIPDVLPNP